MIKFSSSFSFEKHKTLITGGNGMLGSYLYRKYPENIACSRHDLDIRNTDAVKRFICDNNVYVILNCAGLVMNGDYENVFSMYETNAFAPYRMACLCRELDVRFVFISTSRVFDGEKTDFYIESDIPNPIDHYGLSKYMGEKMVENILYDRKYYIIRLPQVLGVTKRKLERIAFYRLIRMGIRGERLNVANDIFNSYSYAKDISELIWDLITSERESGVYHITNQGSASFFELIVFAFQELGINADIFPVSHSFFSKMGKKPLYGALSSSKLEKGRLWKDAMRDFFREFKADESNSLF